MACSASYLKAIIQRGLLLRAPSRGALVEVVDLDHQAVGLEIEGVPLALPLPSRARSPRRSSHKTRCAG